MSKKKVVYKVIRLSDGRSSFSMLKFNSYCMHYYPNTIVKSIKGSIGIMCFETKVFAENFIKSQCVWAPEALEIIDVRPIGKANYPKSICAQTSQHALNNFYEDEAIITMNPPKGTICYKSVEVLT